MTSALAQLAGLAGVDLAYWDIFGQHHEVSEESLLALLRAMRLSPDGPGGADAELDRLLAEDWTRPLAPVTVLTEAAAVRLDLRLPADRPFEAIEWDIVAEDGAVRTGTVAIRDLRRVEESSVRGRAYERFELRPGVALDLGYHEVVLRAGGDESRSRLIIAPAACYTPPDLDNDRVWGPAVQLYALRSARNWGMGDFSDLARLIEIAAEHGAGVVGVSPLHALFSHHPAHVSPYSPSSRRFLNALYIDVEAVQDFVESADARAVVAAPEFQAHLSSLRAAPLVETPAVADTKRRVLTILHAHFRRHHLGPRTERGAAFKEFQKRGGEGLRRFAIYQALSEWMKAQDSASRGWPAGSDPYRDPNGEAVARFASEQRERIEFHEYLQWQAGLQLGATGRRAVELGMRVGMYHDLAVGVDADGFETWARPELYALDARIGAPPDAFCPNGQDWGLPPIIPREMRRDGYQSFIDVLRANMRFGGALRIDHVMGLMRLFWVPAGGRPADGAYVRYPFSDLLAILALESQRNQCLIIGEDLGTVPDEVRDALRPADVLSYRVFYFEKDSHGEFRPPEEYPAQALVTVSTHDLPTLVGFWRERDIAVRDEHGLFPSPDARDAQRIERARDRERLLRALSRAELSSSNVELTPTSRPELTFDSILAVHALLARTPSRLFLFQFEDVLGESDQANLPGTTVEYPNWRRKLATNLEDLAHDPRFGAFTQMLRGERGSGCVRLPPRGQPSE